MMSKNAVYYFVIVGLSLAQSFVFGQNLPSEMTFSSDGRMLLSGTKRTTGFYDTSAIKDLKLYFTQTDYATQLTNNYNTTNMVVAKAIYDGKTYENVGVEYKGNTSYQGVRNQDKKSFGIKVDYKIDGQNIGGYETLNFNNAYQDESYMREVVYGQLARKHSPAVKTNFVHLYINDKDWGIYPNIEQVSGEFTKEWWFSNDGARWRADAPTGTGVGGMAGGGGFGNGTAGLNYLGADTTLFQKYYTLKNSKLPKPWDYLVNTTEKINKTDLKDLETVMPSVMDIDRTLWFLATEIMFGDDDSYVNKGAMDYYIYVDPETKRMTPIETDGNSAIETSRATWSPFFNETKVNFPLLNRLLAIPAYRQRYLAHIRTINEESINPKVSNIMIDALAKKIDALVKADPKALYTYSQFQAEITTIKNFFTTRYNYIKSQVDVNKISPTINKTTFATNGKDFELPTEKNTVSVRTTAVSSEGIAKVYLYYSDNLTGNFTKKEMFDDGKSNDGTAKDGVFGAEIPAFSIGKYVRYYIEAVSANSAGTVSYDPVGAEHNVFVYQIKSSLPITKLVAINEVLASNTKNLDENKQADDWIELYNLTTNAVNLGGYYLSDNPTNLKKWQFPANTSIAANSFLIVWADEDVTQGSLHANFKLSKSGESVYLVSPDGAILDEVNFGEQKDDYGYARNPNGTGSFVSQTATFNADNSTGKTGPTDPVVVTPPPTTITATEPKAVLINIYPNPANEKLIIEVGNHLVGNDLEVYNSRGQMVLKQAISNENNINTTEWTSGLYFLKLANSSRKILIIR